MKSKTIIYLLFVGFMIIASFGSIYFYYNSSKAILTGQTSDYLEAIALSRAEHVMKFLAEQGRKVEIAATHQDISPEEAIEIKDASKYFNELSVLDPEGKIITSTDDSKIGLDMSKDEVFLNGKKETYIGPLHFSENMNKESISISTPHVGGKALVMEFDMTGLYEILTGRTGLGDTGKTYLVNGENYMISPSRFDEDVILKRKIDTKNSRYCFEGREQVGKYEEIDMGQIKHIGHEAVELSLDYRGIEVLGTHVYIPEMDWCLLVEIDEREALGLLRNELLRSALVILIITTIIMGIFVLVSNRLILEAEK